ncbi:CAP domain-containing protein [Natronolimnohabitans sp. A-GB9]|uniref:CAP domain-containing protein n=1 Tax=Natronolimnohabitans sp. A-GB9 TaxID=3069757 RepID=UPI0027B00708|nr:CAP domain-containing protein [Natronolimnohabitans sp. A-GB9]MDQ2051356.1 CAP domain-containing protein [Natronolimnohabitans sp. A-GB9]
MRDRRPGAETRDETSERAVVRSVLRLLVAVALIGALAFGTAMVAPSVLDDLGIDSNDFEVPNGVDVESDPTPSSDPPPAGEREPDVTDPDDPGTSSYETDVETVDSETVEDFVHAEVNDRRAEHGLEPLEWDGTVASVSRAHSDDMAQREYFDHVTPEGEAPMDRFQDVDNYCRGYGENIALTYIDRPVQDSASDDTIHYRTAEGLAEGLVDQWMNSTDHRQAILEEGDTPDWDRGGVGVYLTDDGEVYASHNFCLEW